MSKTIFINVFLVLLTTTALAQKSVEISGVLSGLDPEDKLIYASVIVKDTTDIVEAVITDEQGFFKISDLSVGTYTLEVQYLGYESYTSPLVIDGSVAKIDLGSIKLKSDVTSLDEVVISGETSQVSLKLNKKVFNVGKDLLSQSGSATQVLENVPSVSVDPSGAVSLRGNSNVLILINGRKSGLTSTEGLEQIPSETIKEIEVIANPSARYDAAGSAGIINIILKKNKKNNLNGSVKLISGIPNDYRAIANLNYKKGKINLFTNLGIRYTDYVGLYTRDQTTFNDTGNTFINQREDQDRHDDGQLIYVGFDYEINDKNSITAAYYRNETEDSDDTVLRFDFSDGVSIDSTLVTNGNSEEERSYNQLEFNYTKNFKKEGMNLTVDFQYDFWDSSKAFNIVTGKVFPEVQDVGSLLTTSTRKNDDIAIQSDFVTPLGEDSSFEVGVKYENRLITTSFLAEELNNNEFVSIPEFDNGLDYSEQILAGYIQYSNKFKKLGYLIGLRTEYTNIDIEDVNRTTRSVNKFTRFFPTLNLSYELNEKETVQLSYSKRINRPSLDQLNPFPELIDFNSRFFGNINLTPSFTDSAEITFLKRGTGFTINPSVYFSTTTDYFQYNTVQSPEGFLETSLVNLDRETRYGLEIAAQYKPIKWLSLMGEVNLYRFEQEGALDSVDLGFSDETWYGVVVSQVKLPNDFSFQGRYFYQAPLGNAQIRAKSISFLNLALSKSLLNKKLQAVLAVSNVLNTRKSRERTLGNNFLVDEVFNPNAARWTLSLQYKFNNSQDREAKGSNRD